MEKLEEQWNIQFYAYDHKLNVNFLEDLILSKYNKMYLYVQNELFSKSTEFTMQQMTELDRYQTSNYYLYDEIIIEINRYINTLYNRLLMESEETFEQTKSSFINMIKFETKRLLALKKNMKNLGNHIVDPDYINGILSIYQMDDETAQHFVFNNIHNEVRRLVIASLENNQTIDVEAMVLRMLAEYEVSEEVKKNIIAIYHDERENIGDGKIISFSKLKARRLRNQQASHDKTNKQ